MDTLCIEELLDNIQQKLILLTEGEEDIELKNFNEYLIDGVDLLREYILLLENEPKTNPPTNKLLNPLQVDILQQLARQDGELLQEIIRQTITPTTHNELREHLILQHEKLGYNTTPLYEYINRCQDIINQLQIFQLLNCINGEYSHNNTHLLTYKTTPEE